MKSRSVSSFALTVLCVAFAIKTSATNWPNWRGPNGNGVSPVTELPVNWSETENIRWRVDLPDRGNSTPIVWSNKVIITQAIEKDQFRSTIAFDLRTGKQLWQSGTIYDQEEATHRDNPYCAASPVTDGKTIVSTYGSAGVFAYDMDGNELWQRDLGPQVHMWGNASSPVIHGDTVYIYHGPGVHSALYALNLKNGETRWEIDLPEPVPTERFDGFAGRGPGGIGSFSTTVIATFDGKEQLVISLPEQLRSFDLSTGKELWHCDGLNPLIYTSPVVHGDKVLTYGGYSGAGMLVQPKGTGDITETSRLWYERRAKKGRLGTGVIKDGLYFHINMDGIAECIEVATNEQVWLERLPVKGAKGDSWSSALLVGDLVYLVNQAGEVHVLKASREYEVVASNAVREKTNSSLIVAGNALILRTHAGLWCISEE
jgi:outer membrane protein assembly factor BamB